MKTLVEHEPWLEIQRLKDKLRGNSKVIRESIVTLAVLVIIVGGSHSQSEFWRVWTAVIPLFGFFIYLGWEGGPD